MKKNVFKLRKRVKIDRDKLYKDLYYYVSGSAPRYTLSFGGKIWEVLSRNKIREVKIEDIPPTSKILRFMGVSFIRIDLDDVLDSMRIFLIKHNHGRIYLAEKEHRRRIKMRYTLEELKEELGL